MQYSHLIYFTKKRGHPEKEKKKKHIILTLQPALVFTSRQMKSVQKRVLVMTLDGVISYFGTSSFTIHQKIRLL